MRLARSSGGVFRMLVSLLLGIPGIASAQTTWFVHDEGDLHDAISVAASGDTIRFGANVILTSDLPSVETSLTIDGNGFTLSGANQYRGLAILAPALPYPTVRVQDLTITNTVVTGGAGEPGSLGGGGGGGGFGGAIFVGRHASLTLARVSITGSTAVGGAGGDAAAGGGTGGTSSNPSSWDPSFGAGGDGGSMLWHGGFGAGGGGTLVGNTGEGSDFAGGQGGSSATGGGGGGGAGLGGAIFLEELSSLTIEDGVSIAGNSVQGGAGAAGGTNGAAHGPGFFLHGSETLQFNPGAGTTTIVNDAIVDTVGVTNDPAFATSRWGLWKVGDGTVVLGGNNRYSGGTTVDAGTLRVSSNENLGNSDPSLSGTALFLRSTGTLEITGSNEFNRELRLSGSPTIGVGAGVAATWSGEIWGAGGLHVTGGGSLTLSWTVPNPINSYSGGTVVTGGSTLFVTPEAGVDSALGTGGLTLGDAVSNGTLGLAAGQSLFTTRAIQLGAGGGGFDVGAGSTLEVGNVVSGTGSLTKIGSGTLLLSTVASHTGGTNINAGTLRAGLTDVFPTTSLSIADGATFDLNSFNQTIGSLSGAGQVALGSAALTTGGNGANTTFGGVISGTGALVKTGAGSFTLTGANTYSGGTTVSDGTLIGTTTSLQGDILNDAAVTFDQAAAGTYAGVMSGAGRLTKAGIGSLTLTGANTYSGGTTVSGGMLIGTTTSLQGNILNNAGVTFDQAFNGTYSGVLSGSGTLTKAGAGTLLLAAATSHTGGTNIDAGTLQVGVANVFAPASALHIAAGATFDLNGFNQTIGSLSGTSNLALGSATLTAGGNDANTTFSGVVSGAGSLVKVGTGTLTLSGANIYSGGTTVSGGALIGTAASLQGSILNNAAVTFDQASDGTYGGVMSGSGTLTKSGAGSLTLTGTNTYSGGTTVSGGVLIGTAASLQGPILNNADVTFDQATSGTYAGVMSGIGMLTKGGVGTLTLAGANTYSGGTTVSGGVLIGTTSSLQGDILNNAAVTFDQTTTGTYAGVISGSGTLTKSGAGSVTLTGANTYAGGTTVSAGVLIGSTASLQGAIRNDAAVVFDQAPNGTYAGIMSGTGSLTKSGIGTLTLTGANSYSGGTTISAGLLVGNTASLQGNILNNAAIRFDQASAGTYGGVISGSGTFSKIGAGTLTLGGSNTFTGAASIDAGTLRAGTANVFGPTTAVSVASGATFDLNGFDQSIGTLSGGGNFALGAGTLTTGGDNGSATLSGVISGAGSLVKTGTGALTLTGANTYSGGTTVSQGTLIGTTASLQGNIVNNALVTFNQGTAGAYAGAMSGTGSLTKSGAGTLTLTGANTYTGGTTITGGTLIGNATSLHGSITTNGLLVFDQAVAGTFDGSLGGSGSLQKLGAGTLTLGAANTFTGGTTISGGVLRAGAADVFSSGPIAIGAGATLDLNGFSATLNALSGPGSIALGGAQLTTGTDGGSTTLSGVISGPGSIVKSGSGTLTLTGANTYTGGTTVSGGSLVGTTTSLQGNILNDARVVFDQGFNGTYAGAMSGTGSLNKSGAGTLTLTGVNSYTGGTTITGGTLIGNASSLQGSISTNGLLVFDQAVAGTFNGSLGGSGSLQKLGAGTLTLRGTNTLTGSTLLSEGVLRAGAAHVFSSSGAIALGAGTTLDLNGFSHTLNDLSGPGSIALGGAQLTTGTDGGSTTLSGVISGPGSIVKSGSGTLTLTGANTYSGGTTVSAGILLGTTTSLQGNILNDARVVFDQGFNGTYAGGMSGAGILEKAGTGTLTLTGRNTYSGGTLISGGSIVATPASLAGTVVDHGSLTFSGSADGAFGGTLGGTGSLKKTGTCTLTLNGAHPFSGLTTVSQGRLALNGTLGGSIVVEPGASFAGTGGLLGSLILNGGTLTIPAAATAQHMTLAASAGDRLDTAPLLTVAGNLIAGSDSVLSIPVGPGPIPSLYVGGVAALNGATIDARPITLGAQRNLSYLALGAGASLTVANTTVETADPLLLSSLRKNGNTLAVNIVNLGVPLETAVSPGFSSLGSAIDRLKGDMSGDRLFVIRELLSLDDDELDDAMKQIAGEVHASNRHVEIRSSETFTDLIRSELTDRDHEAEDGQAGWGGPSVRWFGQMSREHVSFGPQNGAVGGGADITDGAGGFELRVSDRWIVGGGGGLGFGSMSLDGLSAASDFSAPRAFGVVGFKPKGFGIRGGGSFSRSKAKNTRRIVIVATLPEELGGGPLSGGIDREAKSEEVTVQSDQWTEYADHRDFGTYRLDYMFGVRRARFARDSFVETGAGALSLEYDGGTLNLTDTDVKVHWWRRKGGIRPYVETFLRRSSGFDYALPVEFADEEESDFETAGLPMGANAFAARVGVTFVRRIGALTFEYRIRKASGQTSQTADLRFRF